MHTEEEVLNFLGGLLVGWLVKVSAKIGFSQKTWSDQDKTNERQIWSLCGSVVEIPAASDKIYRTSALHSLIAPMQDIVRHKDKQPG